MDETAETTKLSGHLPALEMTATADGPLYQAGCSCGWQDPVPQRLAERAGREYDRHIEDVLTS